MRIVPLLLAEHGPRHVRKQQKALLIYRVMRSIFPSIRWATSRLAEIWYLVCPASGAESRGVAYVQT